MEMSKQVTTEHYFGGCPKCGGVDGMTNVYKTHVFFCKQHKTMWSPGSNLFSSAKSETLEYQKRRWDEIGLEEFEEVLPIIPMADYNPVAFIYDSDEEIET